MDARRGRTRHRPARGPGQAHRRNFRQGQAVDADLGDGADSVHDRDRQCSGKLHPAARYRQCRTTRRRRQYFSWPYQCSGCHRSWPRCNHAAALLRPFRRCLAALVSRLGGGLRLDQLAFCQQGADGGAGDSQHPLVRRHVAAEAADQPARYAEGHGCHGTWRQHDHANAGSDPRDRKARSSGGLRSLPDGVVRRLGTQERHLSPPGLHQLRDERLAHSVQPLAAMGREDHRARLRIEERLQHDVHARPQVRLRRPDVQEHQS